jgi:hypothetical protein
MGNAMDFFKPLLLLAREKQRDMLSNQTLSTPTAAGLMSKWKWGNYDTPRGVPDQSLSEI